MNESMKAVRQHKLGGELLVESLPLPEPGPGQVLVKMAAAPINPADLASIRESYMDSSWPFTPGFEGAGTVVKVGKGVFPSLRMGKRVACSPLHGGDGTWAEYMLAEAMSTVVLPSSLDLHSGSMMLVNPLTAMALLQLARKGKHRAIVHNAAASSLGKMLVRLTAGEGLPLISIVRRQEHVNELKDMGARLVLNSEDKNFSEQLHKLSHDHGATFFLDAVTGPQSGRLLEAAPRGSTLVAYARLSGEAISCDPASLIKEEKQITGFQLGNYLAGQSIPAKLRLLSRVKKQMPGSLSSEIRERFALENINEALDYNKNNRKGGKILLVPGHK